MIATYLLIVVCLLFSAFFSGMEIAYITANRMQIELDKRKKTTVSKIIDYLISNPKKFIITMLVGNNVALVFYGVLMGELLTKGLVSVIDSKGLILALQTFFSTIIILFLAEFTPKAIFRNYANESLKLFAVPSFIIQTIFIPLNWFIIKLSSFFINLFGEEEIADEKKGVKEELRFLLSEHIEENLEEDVEAEIQIFHNALGFADVKARECMVPRNEICALEIGDSIESLNDKFIETGFSKVLIYRDKIDNIIGYAHVYEMFKQPPNIRSILLPVQMVFETIPVKEVLDILLQTKKSIAIVLDEYGGTAGILTVEDIVEELFGEIEDEHDKEDGLEEKISENEYLFSGRTEIDYVNEKYGLNLPINDSYETLGGLFFTVCGDIPEEEQEIKVNKTVIIAKKVSETKVEEVYLKQFIE